MARVKQPTARKPARTHRQRLEKLAKKMGDAYARFQTEAATVREIEGHPEVLRRATSGLAKSMVSNAVVSHQYPFSYERIKGMIRKEFLNDPEVEDSLVSELSANISGALEYVLREAAENTERVVNTTLLQDYLDDLKDQVINSEELLAKLKADESPVLQEKLKEQLAEAKIALKPFE